MDEFVNTIDPNKFRRTNGPWNELMLNDPWSVGYVTTLIELKSFQSKEDWEAFYYKMGQYRLKKISSLEIETQQVLKNEQLISTNKSYINGLSGNLKNLNTQNGRTKEELNNKGKILFNFIKVKNPDISLSDCQEAVRFRVICETWNGVILREHNTIKTLKGEFPQLEFLKKDGQFDHKYAVDYELINQGSLICGIQIKPKSYTFDKLYLKKAKIANLRKNERYFQDYKCKVLNVIADQKGRINNKIVINEIKGLIQI